MKLVILIIFMVAVLLFSIATFGYIKNLDQWLVWFFGAIGLSIAGIITAVENKHDL